MGKPASGIIIYNPLPAILPQAYIWPEARGGRRNQRRVAGRSIRVIVVQKELNYRHVVWDMWQWSVLRMELEDVF